MANNRIKEVRERKGITQGQLAKLLGTTQGAVQFWENGKREPTIQRLKDIAKALDCEPWELLPLDMQPKINPKELELLKLLKALASSDKMDQDSNNSKAS